MTTREEWRDHQQWELKWWTQWGADPGVINTFGEETKQLTYAHRMGLVNTPVGEIWPVYDMGGLSVLDLGGGPVSMLLKCRNVTRPTVVDPCHYPQLVGERYEAAGIDWHVWPAEDFVSDQHWDEAWIYNVLQHVISPEAVIKTARTHADLVRIFEWVEIPTCPGHPHVLHAAELDQWLEGHGTIEYLNENGCMGTAYYGVFPT